MVVGPLRLLLVEPLRLFHPTGRAARWLVEPLRLLVEPLRLFHPTGCAARWLVKPLRLFHQTADLLRIRRSSMNAKLTLSMDESVIERAKQAARARNTSVSAMLAGLVRRLDALDHSRGADFIGPLTWAATGLLELGPCRADADLLGDALWKRSGDAG